MDASRGDLLEQFTKSAAGSVPRQHVLIQAAKDLAWEPGKYAPGLSTYRDAAQAFGNSAKAQVI